MRRLSRLLGVRFECGLSSALSMNTRKHTLLFRLGALCLVAVDVSTLLRWPSIETALAIWMPLAIASALVMCKAPTRFRA